MAASARVFTISPGAPFLATLADALLDGRLIPGWPDRRDPLSLAEGAIFLPTRRAARALATILAERMDGGAVLLPRITPLGDVDEAEESALFEALRSGLDDPALPPEVPEAQRRLELASLVLAWARQVDRAMLRLDANEPLLVPSSPADALGLAIDLGALIDTLSIHGKTVADIHALVPERYDRYWDITRNFLGIAAEFWPKRGQELGLMDAALRRHRVLCAEAERLAAARPHAPMIIAGSTGSMPATAALIAAVSRLPRGAVVLPGLDLHLDEPSWRKIPADGAEAGHPGHPQAVLSGLLRVLGVERRDVEELARPSAAMDARERFLSEALRPAETTDLWATTAGRVAPALAEAALADVTVVEAADDREEAQAIALALRQALLDDAATAALITPDRTLAERVCAELKRWDIALDDSAGLPLGRSGPGVLARLVAEAAAEQFTAASLLALLDHPLCRFELPRATVLRGRSTLEIGVLRGPALPPGLPAIEAALARAEIDARDDEKRRRMPGPRRRLRDRDWQSARDVLQALARCFAGFGPTEVATNLVSVLAAHEAALNQVGAPAPGEDGGVFVGPAGEELASLFDDATVRPTEGIEGRFVDYPAFFSGLLAGRVTRRPDTGHPRLRIWGLLEARLLGADTVVIGGLDEKTWPPEARGDAFLNRPMRHDLGLPSPERRIGQTTHDFVQAMGARRVVVTRALKRGGDPTVQSRFLQRMQAVAGAPAWQACKARGDAMLALARLLDQPTRVASAARPRPIPPAERFPKRLSVTEIETLVRDPYAIYAKHILRLEPLDPIAGEPSAAVKGMLVHEVIGRFGKDWPKDLPADVYAALRDLGVAEFARTPELRDRPDIRAFWWPRFLRMAAFMAEWEHRRREARPTVAAEIGGKLAITLKDGFAFELTGRADRIELLQGGEFAIVDFKTGVMPGVDEVRVGFSPQLTLEAAMAKRGAFQNVPAGLRTRELLYVKLSGAAEPGKERAIADSKNPFDVDELAEDHLDKLMTLLAQHRAGERAFLSRPHPKYAKRYAPYDHLARYREWSLAGEAGDEAAP